MAEYKSSPVSLHRSAEDLYNKLTNLAGLKEAISGIPADQIPEDKLHLLDEINVEGDSITIPGGPTGPITLTRAECVEPSSVSYKGVNTPVPLTLTAQIQSTGADSCEVTVCVDIKVPAMLKPMLNGPMEKMVNEVAGHLRSLQ